MKTIFTKSTGIVTGNVKRVFTLSAVAAIAAVPFLSATQIAKADPPRHAPAWGYRDKNRRNDRYDRRNDRRNDRRYDRRNDRRGRYEVFTGTVTDTDGSRKFDMRADGRSYDVYLNSSTRIRKGDVVRVYGERSGGNDIRNARVTVIRRR